MDTLLYGYSSTDNRHPYSVLPSLHDGHARRTETLYEEHCRRQRLAVEQQHRPSNGREEALVGLDKRLRVRG